MDYFLEKQLIKFAINKTALLFKDDNNYLKSDETYIEESLSHHLNTVKNWSEEISFFDLKKSKNTEQVYVPLDLYVSPLKSRISIEEKVLKMPLLKTLDLREESNHYVILGQPGAGKTTTMKYICREMLLGNEHFLKKYNFPILIRLREINSLKSKLLENENNSNNNILWNLLHEILGIQITFPNSLEGKENESLRIKKKKGIIKNFLEKLSPLIILDGFDEIVYKTDKDKILKEIREIGLMLEKSCIIITSRSADFNYNLDKFDTFEISPLDDNQISKFALNWLEDLEKSELFIKQLSDTPFKDTAIRPLTLSHLCAIFERIGSIPEKPKTVYKKVVNLLIEEWDEQRSVKRGSSYSSFEPDRKFDFLSNLSYVLTTEIRKTIFDVDELGNCYNKIYENYGLPQKEMKQVVNELESHTGLFLESGYNIYEFSHKSIQEYLAAEYIVKLPSIPADRKKIYSLANELAIAVAISSNPSAYFLELVFNYLLKIDDLSENFINTFLNRLLVEKPDFHISDDIGWALILLYSLYFKYITNWNSRQDKQMLLFIPDSISKEFNFLESMIKKRTKISNIEKIYPNKIKEEFSDSSEKILTLEKIKNTENENIKPYSKDFIKKLPNIILIKEELLKSI